MSKFYAVRKGRKPGVYRQWDECRKHVIGFRGSRYKKFTSEQEAWDFVQEGNEGVALQVPAVEKKANAPADALNGKPGSVVIYTDGACTGNANVAQRSHPAGWGFVALRVEEDGELKVLDECFGPVSVREGESEYLGAEVTSNNTAELSALGWAMKWILTKKGAIGKDVVFRYDSKYAANSITGVFNGAKNQKLIMTIRKLYEKLKAQGLKPNWAHVKGHSNDKWNDRADHLARRGASAWKKQNKRKHRADDSQAHRGYTRRRFY